MAATSSTLVQKIASSVQKVAGNKSSSWWYNSHMAAASRAISDRLPLVDLVVEVRDARIPESSKYRNFRIQPLNSRHIIVLNKMDLADRSQTKEWMIHFEEQNCMSYEINSHNKDSIKQFLNFLQGRARELNTIGSCSHTTAVMLVGIPNVGKSALASSLHQIGRIHAAEKGKLKRATVSPHPGETKNISSLKIASHPNIFVLDTPGILPPEILDAEVCSKLAINGVISDGLLSEAQLAQYFLSTLNLSDEYKKWEKFPTMKNDGKHEGKCSNGADLGDRKEKQKLSDHTQDHIVQDIRRALFKEISSFDGDMNDEKDMMALVEAQMKALQNAFLVSSELSEDARKVIATKLLNLYRTGRLGRYTLDSLPGNR